MYNGKIPFTKDGNLISYADYRCDSPNIVWKDNFKFKDSMQIIRYYKGRSAAGFEIIDSNNHIYYISLATLEKVILNNTIVNGLTPILEWVFVKRGCNFLMELVNE